MKGKYSLADYVFQFITITAGVLIALLINGLVEWNNNQQLVAAARATIAREVAANLEELKGLSESVAATTTDIDNGLQFADELLSNSKRTVRGLGLNLNLATLNSSGWQSANRTGALGHMDYDEVKRDSELYALQELFDAQQRNTLALVASSLAFMTGSNPAQTNLDDARRLREQLLLLRASLRLIESLGEQLIKAYRGFQAGEPPVAARHLPGALELPNAVRS